MSLRSLGPDLERIWEQLMQQIEEAVDQHGLDRDSEEVRDAIDSEFGPEIAADFWAWSS